MSDLEFTKHWTAERTRKKQTKLTKLSNGLQKDVLEDPFTKDLFSPDELKSIKIAAKALSEAKEKFAHIKEKKTRIEKRKAQELANINNQAKKHAVKILDSLNPKPDTFTDTQLCLWITVAKLTRHILEPEAWEVDINDGINSHYLESDNTLRQRNVWIMRDKALRVLEERLKKAWTFSFENDSWTVAIPISEAVAEIKALVGSEHYCKIEEQYTLYIEALKSYNRDIEAIERRKNIKAI